MVNITFIVVKKEVWYMNKKAWLWTLAAVIYTFIIAITFYSIGKISNMDNKNQIPPISQALVEENTHKQQTPLPSPDNEMQKYIIKEEKGLIVVYKNDQIIKTLDVDLSLLPLENRMLLKEGIEIEGDTNLAEILEDYSELY